MLSLYFYYFTIPVFPLGNRCGLSFELTWIPFTKVCFLPSLVKIDKEVLKKKMKKRKVYHALIKLRWAKENNFETNNLSLKITVVIINGGCLPWFTNEVHLAFSKFKQRIKRKKQNNSWATYGHNIQLICWYSAFLYKRTLHRPS